MTDFTALVRAISERPGMYLEESTYSAYVAYLSGFDDGCGGAALCGIREWLITRLDGYNNLAWSRLVAEMILSKQGPQQNATPEIVIRDAGLVILEFIKYRQEWGLRTVFGEYDTWLRKQDWYDEELYGHHGRSTRRTE